MNKPDAEKKVGLSVNLMIKPKTRVALAVIADAKGTSVTVALGDFLDEVMAMPEFKKRVHDLL